MAKPMINTTVSATASRIATISAASGMLFATILGALHFLEPEFDPTWRFVSEYQLGSFGILMHLAFFALAISLAGTGVYLWKQAKSVLGYIGNVGLFIAGLGILLAGIFTTDPISTVKEAMTFNGNMHVLGASLDYTPVALLLLTFSLRRNAAWRPICGRLFVAAGITLALMFAFMFTLPMDGVFNSNVHAGLMGRFLLVSYLLWLVPAALHARSLQQRKGK